MAKFHGSIRTLRFLVLSGIVLAIAACSSLVPQTAQRLRTIDYRNDDLAGMLVAFDMPAGLQPVPSTSVLTFTFTGKGGEVRTINAPLGFADPGELAASLPPTATDRAYYFLGFSEDDQKALREAQAWVREQSGSATGTSPIAVRPEFCTNAQVDVARAQFSVLVALPGAGALEPLARNARVMDSLVGRAIADC